MPEWVTALDLPVWVTGPDGRLEHVNAQAHELLELDDETCLHAPCHEVIAARDAEGRSFCEELCPARARVRRGEPLRPVLLEVGDGRGRWIQALLIPVGPPDAACRRIVHCALPADRQRRMEGYLARVASRSRDDALARGRGALPNLTPREHEVLALLVADHDLHRIAAVLHVSYFTVRNHVRHILAKLEVHSVEEAVAIRLLSGECMVPAGPHAG